jgi:hypothetical protein
MDITVRLSNLNKKVATYRGTILSSETRETMYGQPKTVETVDAIVTIDRSVYEEAGAPNEIFITTRF